MSPMGRADRQNSSDDNARKNPTSKRKEPLSYHELKQQRDNARADKFLLQQEKAQLHQKNEEIFVQLNQVREELQTSQLMVHEWEERATENHGLYLNAQENYQQILCRYDEEKIKAAESLEKQQKEAGKKKFLLQQENTRLKQESRQIAVELEQAQRKIHTSQIEVGEWEERASKNYNRYLSAQEYHQQTLCLYNREKAKVNELLAKYEEADTQRVKYLTLYNEAQEQLKYERNSKAGIKGWETRRKRENERLKQEIGEMVVLLQESMARKDEAVNNLYDLAARMDKIQRLVDSVDGDTSTAPVGVLQKFRRIWFAIKEILAE